MLPCNTNPSGLSNMLLYYNSNPKANPSVLSDMLLCLANPNPNPSGILNLLSYYNHNPDPPRTRTSDTSPLGRWCVRLFGTSYVV